MKSFNSHKEIKEIIKQRRNEGHRIDIALNKSKIDLERAYDTQYVIPMTRKTNQSNIIAGIKNHTNRKRNEILAVEDLQKQRKDGPVAPKKRFRDKNFRVNLKSIEKSVSEEEGSYINYFKANREQKRQNPDYRFATQKDDEYLQSSMDKFDQRRHSNKKDLFTVGLSISIKGAHSGVTYQMHSWGDIDGKQLDELKKLQKTVNPDNKKPYEHFLNVSSAVNSKWPLAFDLTNHFNNINSAYMQYQIDEINESPHIPDDRTPIMVQDTILLDSQVNEKHIVSSYAACGEVSMINFREKSCLVNVILNSVKGQNKAECRKLNHVDLYELCTGKKVKIGDPMPMTLREAEKLFRAHNISCRAIDKNDVLIYRYDGNITKRSDKTVRMVIDGNHCWSVPKSQHKSFDKRYGGDEHKPVETIETNYDISCDMNNSFYVSKKAKVASAVVNDKDDVLFALKEHGSENKCIKLICNKPEDLIGDLVKNDIIPANFNCQHGIVKGFKIRCGNEAYIDAATFDYDQPDAEIKTLIEYNIMANFNEKLSLCLFQEKYKSTYSFNSQVAIFDFHRGAVSGRYKDVKIGDMAIGFDVAKCYTHHLMNIHDIPVFSKFDEFVKYDDHEIESLTKYIIKVNDCDPVMLEKSYDCLYGFSLMAVDRKRYEIMAYMRPHKIHRGFEIGSIIKELYGHQNLPVTNKKLLLNSIIGVCGKRYNKKQIGQLDDGTWEDDYGEKHKLKHTRKIGDHTLSVRKGSSKLKDGYAHIHAIIMEKNRIMMYTMQNTLLNAGIKPVAIKTDCIFVNKSDQAKATMALEKHFEFATTGMDAYDAIGHIRIEEKEKFLLPSNLLKTQDIDPEQKCLYLCTEPVTRAKRVELKSETWQGWDQAEYDSHFPKTPEDKNIMFIGKTPGTGKSQGAIDYCRTNDVKMLLVCSWNRLKAEFSKRVDACTLHNLLGKKASHVKDGPAYGKKYDLTDIKHIHFEEVYQFGINELADIYDFIEQNKDNFTFSCAGDPFQNRAINDILNPNIDYDMYHNKIFAKMFPIKLTFNYCKRVKTQEQSINVREMCDDLRNGVHISEVREKYGFKYIAFDDLKHDKIAASSAHVSHSRKTTERVNSWAFPLVHDRAESVYLVGDKLLGNPNGKTFKSDKGTIYIASNNMYTITGKSGSHKYQIESLDGHKFVCSINDLVSEFKRDHCVTCHSSQGLTLGKKLYIHDYGNLGLSNQWYYTAMTRCSTLDITFVTHNNIT
jgi:hypothetical protein